MMVWERPQAPAATSVALASRAIRRGGLAGFARALSGSPASSPLWIVGVRAVRPASANARRASWRGQGRGRARRRLRPGTKPLAFGQGAIAQLGERVLCKHEVVGSIPSGSTRCFACLFGV